MDDREKINETIINIIFLFFATIFILINITICLIHIKQPTLRIGFFKVVFSQVILELLLNIVILIISILSLIGIDKGIWFILFPLLFNFSYIGVIAYNITNLGYLMSNKVKEEELQQYDMQNENNSISFKKISFKKIHVLSIIVASSHTLLYAISLILSKLYNDSNKNNLNFFESKWIFYFYDRNTVLYILPIFGFNLLFFILSIPYLIKSYQNKITNYIFLKRYSIYCIFSGVISLIFPISITLSHFFPKNKPHIIVLLYANTILFLIYLIITSVFRLGCYYVQFILSKAGDTFMKKFCFGLRILFKCQEIPNLNFIDYNSTFVFHSLASNSDFIQDLSRSESITSGF